MKRLFCILALLSLFSCACAEEIDLSGLSFDELAALRDRCQYEMWQRDEWQEVTVPVGVWKIGTDIPAGHWNIRASESSPYGWGNIVYCDKLDATGKKADPWKTSFYYGQNVAYEGSKASVEAKSIDLVLAEGAYLIIEYSAMVFTPFTGKPDLGFK